jgi:moderate conductance mechanosensitive channel
VTADAIVVQVQIKTMPGQELSVARELRGRMKRAFDDAGIRISEPVVSATPTDAADSGNAPPPAEPAPVPVSPPPAPPTPQAPGAP